MEVYTWKQLTDTWIPSSLFYRFSNTKKKETAAPEKVKEIALWPGDFWWFMWTLLDTKQETENNDNNGVRGAANPRMFSTSQEAEPETKVVRGSHPGWGLKYICQPVLSCAPVVPSWAGPGRAMAGVSCLPWLWEGHGTASRTLLPCASSLGLVLRQRGSALGAALLGVSGLGVYHPSPGREGLVIFLKENLLVTLLLHK